jgi:hypothetical protein
VSNCEPAVETKQNNSKQRVNNIGKVAQKAKAKLSGGRKRKKMVTQKFVTE